MTSPTSEALNESYSIVRWDFIRGLIDWRLWAFLGLQDIRQRYRRSVLGPLWLTLGLGVTVLGIGLLYGQILKTSYGNYIPFIAISLMLWNLIASVLTESTSLFQGAGPVITSVRIPYTSFVLRTITRNLIVAAHSVLVVVVAFAWNRYPVTLTSLAAIPGIVLICGNLYWMALLIGVISARYRDVAQIINYTVQIALFLTPVIWMPSAIRPGSPFIRINPLAQLLQVVRGPIFDHTISPYSFAFATIMMIGGLFFATFAFYKSRRFIVYWI